MALQAGQTLHTIIVNGLAPARRWWRRTPSVLDWVRGCDLVVACDIKHGEGLHADYSMSHFETGRRKPAGTKDQIARWRDELRRRHQLCLRPVLDAESDENVVTLRRWLGKTKVRFDT